jgi:type IV pilus assembly protein PilA
MRRTMPKGFTLIELLIVVVIIGILAAVAIPKFTNTKQRASRSAGIADMRNLATAQEGFRADSNRYAGMADTGTGPGKMNFTPSNGNTALFLSAGAVGWWGSVEIPGGQSCGIYLNTARPAVIPASTPEGVPVCW